MQSHQSLKSSSTLMRSASKSSPAAAVPSVVHEVLQSPGQPLDEGVRTFMEPRFGHDFSRVRVHADAKAAESARAVNALAYTVGPDIVFGAGQYAPRLGEGQRLLAHELTHVVQQFQTPRSANIVIDNSQEQTAEAASTAITAGSLGVVVNRAGSQNLARQQANYPEIKKQVLEELNRKMPVAITGILDGLDQPTRDLLGADPEISQAIAKLPPDVRNIIRKHIVVGKTLSKGADPRDRVQAKERAAYNSLRAFLHDVTQKISQLISKGAAKQSWINSSNVNVQSLLNLLNGLLADLDAELLIVSFDQAVSGDVGASYDYLNDTMHLRPFTNDASKAYVAARLVHEYAHVKQDRTLESHATKQSSPSEHPREAELQQEIEARREQVYFTNFMSEMGISVGGNPTENFNELLTTNILFSDFEKERAGKDAERQKGTKDIRSTIESAYAKQLSTNAPTRMYVIQIDSQNHGKLYTSATGSPTDLGLIPSDATNRVGLINYLSSAVKSSSVFSSLFVGTGSKQLTIVTFTVIYAGQRVAQFGLEPTP